MQSLKRRILLVFGVIFCSVLSSLLVFGDPALAGPTQQLKPNAAYKVSRTETKIDSPCFGKTAYVKFTFEDESFPGGIFEDVYPIQDNWELIFNTPLDNTDGTFEDLGLSSTGDGNVCGLTPFQRDKSQKVGDRTVKLDLLSGFKTKKKAKLDRSGHFITAKDYYAAIPNKTAAGYNYEFLGSVTALGGDNFPALEGAAVGELVIAPNSIRAPHWHLNYAEAGYCYQGLGQVGVIAPSFAIAGDDGFSDAARIEEMFVKEGEVFLFPLGSQHYLRNIGKENFSCALFFAQDTPINPGQLLTITLQEINKNTPLGTLGPVLNMDRDDNGMLKYTAEHLSQSPDQSYISTEQGPDEIKVVEVCRGEKPDVNNPGCPSYEDKQDRNFDRSIFSRLTP